MKTAIATLTNAAEIAENNGPLFRKRAREAEGDERARLLTEADNCDETASECRDAIAILETID
jgi:hypothetical protein